jgi:sugar lactone lactonase YvrE
MTASHVVADPAQGIGEVPPAGVAPTDGIAEEPPRKRRRKILILFFLLLALVLLLALAIWYLLFRQPIPVPVIPGETIMPGYVTSIYGASRPMSVAVTSAGDRIYIGETAGEQTARIFDSGGNPVGKLLPPTSTGELHAPTYLALDPITGDIYVSDRQTAAIYVYDAAGTYKRSVTAPDDSPSWQPLGLAFDSAGNLYVSDVGLVPQVVRVFDSSGQEIRVIGADAEMNFPNGIAVDANGFVYVTDSNNGRLLVFAQDGSIVAKVGRGTGEGNLGLPRGLAIDGQGRVYVVDVSGQAVFVYGQYVEGTSRLDYLGTFGTEGIQDGAFAYPNGIAVDGRGRLYIADSSNDRVQLWSY